MDRLINPNGFCHSIVEPVKYTELDSVPIDQSSVQEFNIDPDTGRPISDITIILRSQNKMEQERVLSTMQKFDSSFLPDDISDEDAVKFVVPRYSQMPSELAEVAEKFTQLKLDEAKKAAEKKKEAELNKLVEDARNKVKDSLIAD